MKSLVHELEFDTNETGCDGCRSSQRRFSPLFLFIFEELTELSLFDPTGRAVETTTRFNVVC